MKLLNDSYLKNISVLFSGNVIAQLIPFLLAPLITRLFTPDELGLQGNFVALVMLISIIANGRLELAIVLPKSDDKAIKILKIGLKITSIISLCSLVLLFLKEPISTFYQTNLLQNYLPLVALIVFIISTHNLLTQWIIRKKKFTSISIIKIILSILTNGLIVGLGWLKFGVDGLVYGYILGFLITTFILFFITNQSIKWGSNSATSTVKILKEYRDFPLINSLHAFSDILFQDFIILALITSQFGLATTGLYVVMNKYLKAPTRFIGNAIGQAFYPEASINFSEKQSNQVILKKSILISIVTAIPILIIILLFGPQLFSWYLGTEWITTGIFAQIMIFPIILSLITSPISSTPLIYKEQKKSFLINIIGMSLGAVVFYCISSETNSIKYGLIGLAIIQSLLYLVLINWYYQLSKR